jgi:hypothetical protein
MLKAHFVNFAPRNVSSATCCGWCWREPAFAYATLKSTGEYVADFTPAIAA